MKLPSKLPVYLFDLNPLTKRAYQNQDGFLLWSGIYRLDPHQSVRNSQKSQHYFHVPRDSILRMFVDPHNSGVAIRYKILDDQKRLVFRGTEKEAEDDAGTHLVYLQLDQATH